MYRRQDDRSGMVAGQRTTSFIQLQSARKSILDGEDSGGGPKCLLVAKKTFRVVPSIISADRKPISLISTHLSLIIHCIRKQTPSPTRCIFLFQVTRIINMPRASIQRPKTRKNKSTEISAHADMVQRLPPSLSLAIHGIRLDRLLARGQIQIRNKLCAVWRCLAKVSSILKSQQRNNRFVCLPCRTPIDTFLGGLHSNVRITQAMLAIMDITILISGMCSKIVLRCLRSAQRSRFGPAPGLVSEERVLHTGMFCRNS